MPIDLSQVKGEMLYSVAEAARILGQSEQTVRIHLNDGDLKGIRGKNGRWRILGKELVRYVSSKG